jgi:selenocysteine lyase/cysteine desulfurase
MPTPDTPTPAIPDIENTRRDFYAFSDRKLFAPTGIGAVYDREERWEQISPWQGRRHLPRDGWHTGRGSRQNAGCGRHRGAYRPNIMLKYAASNA